MDRERDRKYAYVLTVIDTFTIYVLGWTVAMSITKRQVKALREFIIVSHPQSHQMLHKKVRIEIRNDNDPRFSAKAILSLLSEKHLCQTFTHPYTPEENGHIESYHNTLGKMLDRNHFWEIKELENALERFVIKYNEVRIHSSWAHLTPHILWQKWKLGNIERKIKDGYKVIFKLKIPRYNLNQISGNGNLSAVSCLKLRGSIPRKIEIGTESRAMNCSKQTSV